MTKNKCTLLIDGNWLLQSRMHMIKGFDIDNPVPVKQEATHQLVELMARSINVIINRFKVIDNILLVSDSRSWRLNVEKPADLINVDYKGQRKSDETLDWKFIWNALSILSKNFEKLNITYSYCDEVEGDDWIWYWSNRLNGEGINCIIWSSDNDLKQLVKVGTSNSFTAWYNDRNGLYVHNTFDRNYEDPDTMLDIFLGGVIDNPLLDITINNSKKREANYINPNDIILGKIICGDSGDNIKPVVSWKKGKRNYSITEKMWAPIAEKLHIDDIYKFKDGIDDIVKSICRLSQVCDNMVVNEDLKNRIKQNILYNMRLVWLDSSMIPGRLLESMSEQEYKVVDIKFIRNNFKLFTSQPDEAKEMIDDILNLF